MNNVFLKTLQISQKKPIWESLFNKVAGLKPHFLRTPILKNIWERLLL